MKTLCGHLADMGLSVSKTNKNAINVAKEVIRYICGVDETNGAYAFQRNVKPIIAETKKSGFDVPFSAKAFRLELVDDYYILIRLKYFCLNFALGYRCMANLHQWQKDFGISRNDVVLVRLAMDNHTRGEIKRAKKELDMSLITKEAFIDLSKTFSDIYTSVDRHIRSRTYNKLRFLFSRQNIEHSDFESDCRCKALTTFYKLMPTGQSVAYVENYVKRAVTNHITNIIYTYTSEKRQRSEKSEDGFGGDDSMLIVMSENQIKNTSVSYTDLESDSMERLEDSLNFEIAVRRFGTSPKRYALIHYASGRYGKKFTTYLHKNKKISQDKDNTDLSYPQLCKFSSEYMDLEKATVDRFLRKFAATVANRTDLLET